MIGILGGTRLALTLGKSLSARSEEIAYGVRKGFVPNEIEWKILNMSSNPLKTFKEVIDCSEMILICCENSYLEQVFDELSNSDLKDKIVIDCTNSDDPKIFACNTDFIKSILGTPKIFKAFNNLGLDYPNSDPMGVIKETYYCGPDIPEKLMVKQLIAKMGFKAIDAGKLENAPLLEAMFHLRKAISNTKNASNEYHFKLIAV
jgi:8-hydroxy-5-deazaflavin:NADPH oxidoreductase